MTLPIVLFDFDEGVIKILRGVLLRLEVDGVLHAKKRVGGKIVVALGAELQHHGEFKVGWIDALLAAAIHEPNGIEAFVVEHALLKGERRDKAKTNGGRAEFNSGQDADLPAGLGVVGEREQLVLVVGVGFGHDREVWAIDTKHKAKMNEAFVEVFITLLLLSLSHGTQAA